MQTTRHTQYFDKNRRVTVFENEGCSVENN